MTIAAIRKKLHNYIDEADDEKIINILTILEDQKVLALHWSDDKKFVAELDERVRRYEEGIDPAYTLDESKALLNKFKEEFYKSR
jgi:hypothetical protein